MPENGNLPAQANPGRAGKMTSRHISLGLFIKFDNQYRRLETEAFCYVSFRKKEKMQ